MVAPMAILRAPTSFYALAHSDRCIRLLARLADQTSLWVIDNDTLRRISSVQAATITIRREHANLYVPTCTGWSMPMPLLPVAPLEMGSKKHPQTRRTDEIGSR